MGYSYLLVLLVSIAEALKRLFGRRGVQTLIVEAELQEAVELAELLSDPQSVMPLLAIVPSSAASATLADLVQTFFAAHAAVLASSQNVSSLHTQFALAEVTDVAAIKSFASAKRNLANYVLSASPYVPLPESNPNAQSPPPASAPLPAPASPSSPGTVTATQWNCPACR